MYVNNTNLLRKQPSRTIAFVLLTVASGVWKSEDDGQTWDRVQQFTFPYHVTCVGSRVYASGARSISHIGKAGWGDGGAFFSDNGGLTWHKNEALPLLSNLNSLVIDPADDTQVFYTFFGGGMMHGPRPEPATPWSLVSSLLDDDDFSRFLPTIPTHEDVSDQLYGNYSSSNYPFKVHTISNFPDVAGLCNEENNLAPALAGPKEICTAENCAGTATVGSEQCRAVINANSIQLRSKFGTYWAKALANPAWIQFIFEEIPEGSTKFHFSVSFNSSSKLFTYKKTFFTLFDVLKFTLDHRYRPELYGGNPCSAGSLAHDCQLCKVPGPWDHSMEDGVHVLWSTAGRSNFVITGPYDVASAYDAGDLVQTLEAPPEMNYSPGEYPIATFLTFSTFPTRVSCDDFQIYAVVLSFLIHVGFLQFICRAKLTTP